MNTPRVDALMAKWDDDGASRGAAFIELRDLARELESALAAARQPVAQGVIAWVRRQQDGTLTSEYLADAVIEPVRKTSGGWLPMVLAQPVEVEPVAWRYRGSNGEWYVTDNLRFQDQANTEIQSLYTHPAPVEAVAGVDLVVEAARKLVASRGRFHTEQNDKALAAALDAMASKEAPAQDGGVSATMASITRSPGRCTGCGAEQGKEHAAGCPVAKYV